LVKGAKLNSQTPLISVIISTYNSEKFIKQKIEDVLNQSIADLLEIIIVNSGSRENEDIIVREFFNKGKNIKYIRTEERETIYKAWNRGISASSGKYITNSNTDDRLRQDALELLAQELDKNPDVVLVYADQYVTSTPNELFNARHKNEVIKMPDFDYLVQLDRCIVFSQPMWRASLHFDENVWFDENYEVCGDHEFELNISFNRKMKHIPVVLGSFYKAKDKSNKSFQRLDKIQKERESLTTKYIRKYISDLGVSQLNTLYKIFGFYTKLPIPISYLILKCKMIYSSNHVFNLEFIYFITSVILERKKDSKEIQRICSQFLKWKYSSRIEQLLKNNYNLE